MGCVFGCEFLRIVYLDLGFDLGLNLILDLAFGVWLLFIVLVALACDWLCCWGGCLRTCFTFRLLCCLVCVWLCCEVFVLLFAICCCFASWCDFCSCCVRAWFWVLVLVYGCGTSFLGGFGCCFGLVVLIYLRVGVDGCVRGCLGWCFGDFWVWFDLVCYVGWLCVSVCWVVFFVVLMWASFGFGVV